MSGCSRLAPSPTGALHLGNARTFLVNWALARQRNWALPMRIEDLDGPRIKAGAAAEALDVLQWLGLDWDGQPLVQSEDLDPYRLALRTLQAAGEVYQCHLTRRQIEEAASAPHEEGPAEATEPDGEVGDDEPNWRFRVSPGSITIDDSVAGSVKIDLTGHGGDFVAWTKRDAPAYQLAVVVDDARQGVTDVVRGDDLLPSAARQVLLFRALGLPTPAWWHLPLVRGEDGRRLAKRHGDTRLTTLRDQGVPAARIIGLCGAWCGLVEEPTHMTVDDFKDAFTLEALPRDDVTWGPREDAWLRGA